MVSGAQPGVGDVIAERFRIDRLIGVGGTGSVFEARDISSGNRFAIKILHPVLQRHPVIPQRFLREAAAARALMTPHAVKVEAEGNLADGIPYIVMEYLDGEDLGKYITRKGGRLKPDHALFLADQIAAGIHEAHARGILHRDLKPENIFVIPSTWGEVVKVVDFGISKIFTEEGVKLTQTGVTVGTPQYMPVEQLRGTKGLDGRVDVYAVGVILFEMVAGVRPYDGFTYEEVILKVATTTAPPIATYCPDLPPALAAAIDRAIARERDQRFLSMADLRQAIAPFWSGRCPICSPQSGRDIPGGQAPYLAPGASLSQSGAGVPPQNLSATGGWGQPAQSAGNPQLMQTGAGVPQQNLSATGGWGPQAQAPGNPAMMQSGSNVLPANLSSTGGWGRPSGPGAMSQTGPFDGRVSAMSVPSRRGGGSKALTLMVVMFVAALLALVVVAIIAVLWLTLGA